MTRLNARTRQNTRPKAWFVRYQDEERSKKTLRFDTWFVAAQFWLRLKWHPYQYNPKIFKGE